MAKIIANILVNVYYAFSDNSRKVNGLSNRQHALLFILLLGVCYARNMDMDILMVF